MSSRDSQAPVSEVLVECPHCGQRGEGLYWNLRDRFFGSPGRWGFTRCSTCELIWLSPRPTSDDIGQTYVSYYTHGGHESEITTYFKSFRERLERYVLSGSFSHSPTAKHEGEQQLGGLLGTIAPLRDLAGAQVMYLQPGEGKRLLDVGSGSGDFLARMKDLGWDVTGLDPDPRVSGAAAEELGIRVIPKPLLEANLEGSSFDAVTLSHVIEHVHSPSALLAECYRVLTPGGRLVVITPNGGSLGHSFFRHNWRGLEPPRHLYIFSESSLRDVLLAANFEIQRAWTISRMAIPVWHQSRPRTALVGETPLTSLSLRGLGALLFYLGEELMKVLRKSIGEELVAIATKHER